MDKFVWGKVINTHKIGDIKIIEYFDRDEGIITDTIKYHVYVNEKDTCHSFSSLDGALLYALCYKYDNGWYTHAYEYTAKAIGLK